jgi:NAD+ synthase (glutamine-hydrolysing)
MSFFNLYRHNFVRVAVAVPPVHLAEPLANAAETVRLAREAAARRVALVVFPELGLSGYSCEDLFHQRALIDASLDALRVVVQESKQLGPVLVVGLPLCVDERLHNCAAVVHRGRLLGLVPKTYLPNYLEFYEMRQFAPGDATTRTEVELSGLGRVPFGARIVFAATDQPLFKMYAEICEDLWAPVPPSSYGALAGATVLVNLSASNVTIGKDAYREELVSNQSGRCIAAYVYTAAGFGESTTDLAWDGHAIIAEDGAVLARTKRFALAGQLVTADLDLERIAGDRVRQTTFAQSVLRERLRLADFRHVSFELGADRSSVTLLDRTYERFPYVPNDSAQRERRCEEVFEIQVQGLMRRLQAMRTERVVIGVSGGLDSTHALLVCARAMDRMGFPRANILAFTLPGFATSSRTLAQAHRLMKAVGATSREIDIRPSCLQMLKDIGHPYASGTPLHDVTFENVQAGERTSHLFRLANQNSAPVVGTGDLSEIALGWSTYGVGDQMSHYNVNASVPKTLIQYLIRYVAATDVLGGELSAVLRDVLLTEISPELVPGTDASAPAQRSEQVVGPYDLQDFHLYYTLRYGYTPAKVAFLAWTAWHDAAAGHWPDVPADERRVYDMATIKRWLGVFLRRFFETSQFKRSALPNAPKVGSGGSLSPRGDWRAPSDASATLWLDALREVPDKGPGAARPAAGAARRATDSAGGRPRRRAAPAMAKRGPRRVHETKRRR